MISAELLYEYPREFKRGRYSLLSHRLAEMHGVDENRVVLGYGAEDVLKQALSHHLGAGDRLFLPGPSWWYYRELADEVGASLVEYPLVERADGFHYDRDDMVARHGRTPARVVVISSPNNPTGNAFPTEQLRETIAAFGDAVVLLDEAYWGYTETELDAASLTNELPNLLVLRTFSKLYGLAGARVGYAVAGAGLKSFLKVSARYLGFSRIIEVAAIAALDDHAYYAGLRRRMAADRARLSETLRRHDGVRVYDSQANFVLARFPGAIVKPLKAGLEQRGLVVKFLTDEPGLRDCARITLGTESETCWLCESFDELLPELLKRCA